MEEPRRPRFFKVLIGNFARRIEIPQGFLCYIPDETHIKSDTKVLGSAKIINGKGNTWPVELEKIDGHVFLTTGWPKFVESNCLVEGEFLVFRYNGNMQFMVSVFGANAVEKAVLSSESGAQATENLQELPCSIIPSRKRWHSDDKLTETIVTTRQGTQGDEYISSQDTIGFLDADEVGLSKDNLETYFSKEPMDDDKAKAISEVMRTLHVDKLTVDLFCATLCFYKWKVEAAAEDLNICRGKLQIQVQSLKQKLVLQFDFVKRQLQHFFPPHDDSERIKNNLEGPNLSNQSRQCGLTVAPVKRRLVDEHESCDMSHLQKRRIVELQLGSLKSQTPRRSPRLAHLNNIGNSTNKVSKARAEVLKPSAATINQVKGTTHKSRSLCEKPDNALKVVREETGGSLRQDLRKLDSPECTVGLSKVHGHDQGIDGDKSKEQVEDNAVGSYESLMSTVCSEPSPTNYGLTAHSRINELSFTWKRSQHGNPLKNILLDIQRDNFVNTISSIQKIIRDDSSDVLSADVIEATVRIGILKSDLCLNDRNAQKIVNALLAYAKKVKGKHNFNIEMRKVEFSAKLQDLWKWQLKELEITYASLESDFNKAAANASIFFLTLEEHKKKLHSIKDGVKDLQQALMIEGDEIQKLTRQVAEQETVFQKSVMEKVRAKVALKSYQKILDDIKQRLASTEPGSFDVHALVKVEMDNMSKEIELSKGSLLNINFKKE